MRGGWRRDGGTHVCAPRPVSLPRRPSVPGAQAQLGALRFALGGRGPEQVPDWPLLAARANQRLGRGPPRPVSRTHRCSLVSSQPVVRATGALKINFKEPPPGGARRVVMTTGPQGPRRAFPTAPSQQLALAGRGWGGIPPRPQTCRWDGHLLPRTPLQVSASPPPGEPHPLPSRIPQNPQTHQSTIFLLPFCKRYKKIQRSRKNVNLPLQPHSLEIPAILVYVDIQVWYVYRFWHQNV